MQSDDGQIVSRELTGGVRQLEISRPSKHGALTNHLMRELLKYLQDSETNPAVRSVVLSSVGPSFCAGADLNALSDDSPQDDPGGKIFEVLAEFSKPIVAAVQGAAIGMGATMLLHCDAIFATEEAFMRMPFVELGLTPEGGATVVLPMTLGPARAKRILLMGDVIAAPEAVDCGLWTEIVTLDDLRSRATEVANLLASHKPEIIRETKHLMRHGDFRTQLDHEMSVFAKYRQ